MYTLKHPFQADDCPVNGQHYVGKTLHSEPKRVVVRHVLYCICFLLAVQLFISKVNAQKFSLTAGTEFPYQHYLGVNLNLKDIDFSLRTGLLVPPYSDALIDALEIYDYPDEVQELLKASYEFGWMNSFGVYKRFGKEKQWYVGPEFRVDYLDNATTPAEVFQILFEDPSVSGLGLIDPNAQDIKFSLLTLAFGARVGRSFRLFKDNPSHLISTELAVYRYINIHSKVTIDGNNREVVDELTDELLWNDFYGPHGQLLVLAVSYTYVFPSKK